MVNLRSPPGYIQTAAARPARPGDCLPIRYKAMVVWALGHLDAGEHAGLLALIDRAALFHIAELNTLDLANLLWGYAKLGRPLSEAALRIYAVKP